MIAAVVSLPGVNPRDPDARYTVKRAKTYFGYKAHLAVDEGSGLVRQAEMTWANVAKLSKCQSGRCETAPRCSASVNGVRRWRAFSGTAMS